ncbi:MAG: aminoacyl-tRNA hydrolase [Firmicutes bacterium]|nr:aminoacyl-tRNA hydrolase [Bacillota bacterium]
MKLIAGLGNPEPRFNGTPHNVGFAAIDVLCQRLGVSKTKHKKGAEVIFAEYEGAELILAKPLTYMNLSGLSIRKLVKKYKIALNDIVVLVDDISVKPGQVKLKEQGSAGSHNGLKNIAAELNSLDFKRLRIGVGEPAPGQDLSDYVLGKLPAGIKAQVEEGICLAADLALKQV